MSSQNQFENALRTNGDSGRTYRIRRTNGERFNDTTFDHTLGKIESRIGRSASMSVLAHTKTGPVGEVKFNPELSPEEAIIIHGLHIAIESGSEASHA